MSPDDVAPGQLELAFACSWWRPKEPTWSYTSAHLRDGLRSVGVKLRDIDAQPPFLVQATMAVVLTSLGRRPWKYASAYQSLEARRILRAVDRVRPSAVLEVANLVVPTPFPTYGYQDMNFAVAVDHYASLGRDMVSTIPSDLATLERLATAQRAAAERLDGMFAMGSWYRDYLIERQGLLPDRVHAVGGGISRVFLDLPPREIAKRRTRLLFVGTEFLRKGGDVVIEAVARLNRQGDRRLRLTVVGPPTWPLAEDPPEWVDFRGSLPSEMTAGLFQSHDVLVMPSRFEAYGKVFLEARAAGIPAIGRDAYSMPELVEPGVGGALWTTDSTDDLAELIARTLDDDALHERCRREAKRVAAENTWEAVARRILAVIVRRASRVST